MNQDYILPDDWTLIEEGFDPSRVESSESLFSLGNGAMGQRANFEEHYSGPSLQGSYIGGVYYPDKTKVGWWKNGYPEYFAKVLNAPNWIGINVKVNGHVLDLMTCNKVLDYKQILNMKEGYLMRVYYAVLPNGVDIAVRSTRFLSLKRDELGAIKYDVHIVKGEAEVEIEPYLDSGITNMDANWDEKFWETLDVLHHEDQAFITAKTHKTNFHACTFMETRCFQSDKPVERLKEVKVDKERIGFTYKMSSKNGKRLRLEKFGGYVTDLNHHKDDLIKVASEVAGQAAPIGFRDLMEEQKQAWAEIWEMSDITIEGDIKAQQGIRFNIFQLNQTYLGKDPRLNIGPKGFTGEKYGGSTYWDTEAYCFPFYMATKDQSVARNLLVYRYNHLQKAIENAEKLGFTDGAALYPMVTMNGEECHNEWEITFEEIHRNGAMIVAIVRYYLYTGESEYIAKKGLEVMIAISRFWAQRVTFSQQAKKYMILGVTGPNEYENNVNNNWYTNYIASYSLSQTNAFLSQIKDWYPQNYERIIATTGLKTEETEHWQEISQNMYYPYDEELEIYLQQDGFLDKELMPASGIPADQRPINQHWSWDRILRSCFIKQADVLQGFYFFPEDFTKDSLKKHFDFYEPMTVHESSLSPCIHSILAARLGRVDQAYEFYLRTARLDLDDYNNEVKEGCHITSMAGTWLSIVEGFGGMRTDGKILQFDPIIPKQWESYSFKINYREWILKVHVDKSWTTIQLEGDKPLELKVGEKTIRVDPGDEVSI